MMATIADELHISLRREARKLLDDAAAMTVPSRRRAILARAFSLVQQAEIYRQAGGEDLSPASAPLSPFAKRKVPAGKLLPAPAIAGRETTLAANQARKQASR